MTLLARWIFPLIACLLPLPGHVGHAATGTMLQQNAPSGRSRTRLFFSPTLWNRAICFSYNGQL